MIGQLVRNFQRALTLQSHLTKSLGATTKICSDVEHHATTKHPFSLYAAKRSPDKLLNATARDEEQTATINDMHLPTLSDGSEGTESTLLPIAPYSTKNEQASLSAIVKALRSRFRLSERDVQCIMSNEMVTRTFGHRQLTRTLELLCMEGVNRDSFVNYPWLITLERARLSEKLAILRKLPILRDINDFVPLLRLTVQRLMKIVNVMSRERDIVPYGNRIYYISRMLKMEPKHVTKYLSKRLFILEMPFEMLEENLQLMLGYNVKSESILKDLWAFRYKPKSVHLRLERARRAKKDKIMPWMVRAAEPILQRSFKLKLDELSVLGDKKNVNEYVGERLGFDVATTNYIMAKHAGLTRVRVTKIKEVLDYLLNEAGFTPHEIAAVPRILCHSLETTKKRIDELKSYGCRPSSLVIVCRSKREYDKFVKSWLETEMRMSIYKAGQNSSTSDLAAAT